jgi:hypothetical protein
MKVLFGIGLLLLVAGVLSLFVPLPQREHSGVKVGDLSIGVTTQHDEKVAPAVSAVMIVAGVGMLAAGRSQKS